MQPVEDKRTFLRNEHVKSSLQIKHIMDGGCSLYAYPIKCYYQLSDAESPSSRLAVMVPKKRFPHAVDRNRMKRLMRECYRLGKSRLAVPDGKCCSMCWISVANELPSMETVRAAIDSLFQNINKELENH